MEGDVPSADHRRMPRAQRPAWGVSHPRDRAAFARARGGGRNDRGLRRSGYSYRATRNGGDADWQRMLGPGGCAGIRVCSHLANPAVRLDLLVARIFRFISARGHRHVGSRQHPGMGIAPLTKAADQPVCIPAGGNSLSGGHLCGPGLVPNRCAAARPRHDCERSFFPASAPRDVLAAEPR